MANPVDKGIQKIITKFLQSLSSKNENKGFYKIIPSGVYEGGSLSYVGNDVTVTPLICFVYDNDPSNLVALRIETTVNYTLVGEVTTSTPYIVANYEWVDSENNYLDITAKAVGSLDSNDIILGKATFTGPNIDGFDYSERDSYVSYKMEESIITTNHLVDKNDLNDRVLIVTTSTNDITITFPSITIGDLIVGNAPIKIKVYNQDTSTGRVIITGNVGDDIYLRSNESAIIELSETSTGIYEWIVIQNRNFFQPILKDVAISSILAPSGSILFEFSNDLISSTNILPEYFNGINFVDYPQSKWNFKKSLFIQNDYVQYCCVIANTGFIKLRIYTGHTYTVGTFINYIDTRTPGTNEDGIHFFYDFISDLFKIRFLDNLSNMIEITGPTITSDGELNNYFDIVITWDTSTNTADFYIDGAAGAKTIVGSGITTANFTIDDTFTLGSNVENQNLYFSDMIIGTFYDNDTSNHDGTANVKPYYTENKTIGINHDYSIDEYGNLGVANLNSKTLVVENSVGIGQKKDSTKSLEVKIKDNTSLAGMTLENLTGKIELTNAVGAPGVFLPFLNGYSKGANAVAYKNTIPSGEDTGIQPAHIFDASVGGVPLSTRDLFEVRNNDVVKFSIDSLGRTSYPAKKITSANYIHGNSITAGTVFSALSTFIPNNGDSMLVTGIIGQSGIGNIVSRADRFSSTEIRFYIINTNTYTVTIWSVTSGGATTASYSISW